MIGPIDIIPGCEAERPASGRRTLGGVERAAPFDALKMNDEPRSARRRATAQGGRRAAAMNLVGLTLGYARAARFTLLAALLVLLATHERAEARVATQQRAASASAEC